MEYFRQYNVKFARGHRDYLEKQALALSAKVDAVETQIHDEFLTPDEVADLQEQLDKLTVAPRSRQGRAGKMEPGEFREVARAREESTREGFFHQRRRSILSRIGRASYADGDVERRIQVPAGDVLHQFRKDVQGGQLPAVSWLVAPANLSDHPSAAWFGAWYLSEAMNILTQNPEVWKKTIFILTYDENDGYFDHAPPFVAPHPHRAETGFASKGIDTSVEYVELEQDRSGKPGGRRESPIGLGYRVPMIVASPWSRGGCVCSQVFDHTSVLQFLEKFLTHKTGKPIEETNISQWRRTVCGDLTSVFRAAPNKEPANPPFLPRDAFFKEIDRAKYKPVPSGYVQLTHEALEQIRRDPRGTRWLARQEPGVRPSCALPYELYVDGALAADRKRFAIQFQVRERPLRKTFGGLSVYRLCDHRRRQADNPQLCGCRRRAIGRFVEDQRFWRRQIPSSGVRSQRLFPGVYRNRQRPAGRSAG